MNEQKELSLARSYVNGITFYSPKYLMFGVRTLLDENENFESKTIFFKFEDLFEVSQTPKKTFLWIILSDILVIALSIILSIFTNNFGFLSAAILYAIWARPEFYRFIKFVFRCKFKEPSLARFHAAEHMAVNAYNQLQRIPTLDELRKASRFSKHCQSQRSLLSFFILSLLQIAAILFYNTSFLYLIAALIILFFEIIVSKKQLLSFLQIFVVSKPTDKELELAIEGLKQLEIVENNFEEKGWFCFEDIE